jgi:imidazolonepropionase-like amidohydrolase
MHVGVGIGVTLPRALQAQAASPAASLVIRDVTLIDGTGAAARPHVSIVVRDGRIAALLPSSATQEPQADVILNGSGLFVVPGLIDAHVHLSGAPWAEETAQIRRALRGGVTAVYDVAGDTRLTGDLARAVIAGEIEGPAIYDASLIAGPAFFTDPRVVASSRGYKPGEAPWALSVTPQTDLVRAVAAAKGTGAVAIKLYAALDGALAGRITEEAHRQGLKVVAHATVFPGKPSELAAAGVDLLAHTPYLVWDGSPPTPEFQRRARGDFLGVPAASPVIERLLVSMRDHHVALNPTLWVFAEGQPVDSVSRVRTPWMNAATRRAQELGVSIVAGTDNLIDTDRDPLPTLHRELELLVAAGLTPLQALVAATQSPARAMGIDSVRGTIEVGKAADLLLLEANPLDDIKNTRRIRTVIKDGTIAAEWGRGRGLRR